MLQSRFLKLYNVLATDVMLRYKIPVMLCEG